MEEKKVSSSLMDGVAIRLLLGARGGCLLLDPTIILLLALLQRIICIT